MPKSCEPQSVIDAAEQAVADGRYASAEELLRDAARLQEANLGPLHPDLANTLNNLGILCEFTDKPADAERCYRKAYAITTAVLEPDHPFAATSRKNLRSFCEAHGLPIEYPAPPLVESPAPLLADAAEPEPEVVSPVQPPARPHVPPWLGELRRFALRGLASRFTMSILALSLCGLASILLIGTGPWLHSSGQAESESESTPVGLTPSLAERSAPGGPVAETKAPARAASATGLTLASATICRDLTTSGQRAVAGGWQCDPARGPFDSGALFFLTRLKSPDDTRVQHRWYRDDRLYREVSLRVRANELDGYRTYSRYTMNKKSAGNWRVELRSSDGVLLHEERFVVR
jgi:Protein of unknown function (DUF2914)/Tetratricopeptide repeat